MKKYGLLIILSVLYFTVYSQGGDSVKVGRFSLGITFSPDYSYRSLTNDGSTNASYIIQSRNISEIAKLSYSTGISVMYDITKGFLLETGIYFSDKGYKTKNDSLLYPNGLKGISTIDYEYYYLDIPIIVSYFLQVKKFRFYVLAGVAINLFSTGTTISAVNNSDGTSLTDVATNDPVLGRVDLSINVGFAVSYNISKKVLISLNPVYRRTLFSIVTGDPIQEYLYSFGVNTGVYYRF